jgi:hypothetical protein
MKTDFTPQLGNLLVLKKNWNSINSTVDNSLYDSFKKLRESDEFLYKWNELHSTMLSAKNDKSKWF